MRKHGRKRDLVNEIEQLRVQLAGCSVAAAGYDLDLDRSSYGWSVAFDDVVKIRKLLDEGITAMRLTREYVGADLLPATPGWDWFDWMQKASPIALEKMTEERQDAVHQEGETEA